MEVKEIKDSQERFIWAEAALTYGKLATRTVTGTQDSWAAHFSVISWYTSSMLLWLHIRTLVEPSETEDRRQLSQKEELCSDGLWSEVNEVVNDRLQPLPHQQQTSISHFPINQQPSHKHTHLRFCGQTHKIISGKYLFLF